MEPAQVCLQHRQKEGTVSAKVNLVRIPKFSSGWISNTDSMEKSNSCSFTIGSCFVKVKKLNGQSLRY